MRAILVALCVLVCLAARGTAAEPTPFTIGYLELADDLRYAAQRSYARIQLKPVARPFAGAEIGIADAAAIGRVIGTEFSLARRAAADQAGLLAVLDALYDSHHARFFLVDLDDAAVLALADAVAGRDVLLLNLTAPDNRLRGEDCRRNVAHVTPSRDMLADALIQYLVAKRWTDFLLLVGSETEDAKSVAAIERAAKRFGARIRDIKAFLLSNDPRQRERNNIALLTAGDDYDVVVVVDHDGEFGRYVPYQINAPRPVVGTTGLVAQWWTWAWERHGAPQLNSRFEAHAARRMSGRDWSAWIGVKALVQAVMRAGTTAPGAVAEYLLGDAIRIDGALGPALNFRPWDHQLRIPILITTHNAVVARAPLSAFLHRTNTLDTLGADEPDSSCRFE